MQATIIAKKDRRAVLLIEKANHIEYGLVTLYEKDNNKPLLSKLDSWMNSEGYYTSLLKPLMLLEEYDEHIDAFMRDIKSVVNDCYENRADWGYYFNKLDDSTKEDIIYTIANELCEDESLAEHMNSIIVLKLEDVMNIMKIKKEDK